MGRKKQKEAEHVNLERWMVSYSDFVTLLFATFVVLYALSQVDIKDFKTLEDSIKQAFAAPSVMQGSDGLMDASSSTLFDTSQSDSMITPLMMEYLSAKYEEQSLQEIEKSINEEVKAGEINDVEAIQTDRGLIIRFKDDYLFQSGSAKLIPEARKKLDIVGAIIAKKFILHNMRIEGHTDNQGMSSSMYPSNWELSSARASTIIRYFIGRFSFMPSIFTAVGFADTRPIEDNNSPAGRSKNRRVEILILKNKYKSQESATNGIMQMSKQEQEHMQSKRLESINRIDSISEAAKKLTHGDKKAESSAINLNKVYQKEINRLSTETNAMDTDTKNKITGHGLWLRPPAKNN